MKSLAIITARGGSRRIPRKNIRNFCGKPIIRYSIEAALGSNIFEEVMVSTDDEEIARIAVDSGAIVPFYRSSKNSNDYANTSDVVLEVLEEYKKLGRQFDYACCIYPTAPFVTGKKIAECMKLLIENDADSSMPVIPFSFPPQRGLLIDNNRLKFMHPEYMFTRSQDLETIYHDSGQFYWISVTKFLSEKRLIMQNTIPYIISELEVQDIDNESDWQLAEVKYRTMIEKLK